MGTWGTRFQFTDDGTVIYFDGTEYLRRSKLPFPPVMNVVEKMREWCDIPRDVLISIDDKEEDLPNTPPLLIYDGIHKSLYVRHDLVNEFEDILREKLFCLDFLLDKAGLDPNEIPDDIKQKLREMFIDYATRDGWFYQESSMLRALRQTAQGLMDHTHARKLDPKNNKVELRNLAQEGVVEAVYRDPSLFSFLPDEATKRRVVKDFLTKFNKLMETYARENRQKDYREEVFEVIAKEAVNGNVPPEYVKRTIPGKKKEKEKVLNLLRLPAIAPYLNYAVDHGSCPHRFNNLAGWAISKEDSPVNAPLILSNTKIVVLGREGAKKLKVPPNRFEPYKGTETPYAVFSSASDLKKLLKLLHDDKLYRSAIYYEDLGKRNRGVILDHESVARELNASGDPLRAFLESLYDHALPRSITVEATRELLTSPTIKNEIFQIYRRGEHETSAYVVNDKFEFIVHIEDRPYLVLEAGDNNFKVTVVAKNKNDIDGTYELVKVGTKILRMHRLVEPEVAREVLGQDVIVSEAFFV